MIEAVNIHKKYGHVKVLDGIDLHIKKGEVVAIIGTSGSGKSTLLRCLNTLETVQQGTIKIDGEILCENGKYKKDSEIREIITKMGMVFQNFNLFPQKTVIRNLIEAPVLVKKTPKDEAIAYAELLLERVGLSDKRDCYPSMLSGGQQQRVAIARALAMKPEMLFFDEPTSALDPELTGEVLNVIRNLAKDGNTMIVVTHEIEFAREVASRVIFIDNGNILADGTPEEIIVNPTNERIIKFLQKVK